MLLDWHVERDLALKKEQEGEMEGPTSFSKWPTKVDSNDLGVGVIEATKKELVDTTHEREKGGSRWHEEAVCFPSTNCSSDDEAAWDAKQRDSRSP